jgi:hypothetical protein
MNKMKQMINKSVRLLFFAALVFFLQSCLKNNNFYTDFSKGAPSMELPLAAKYANKPYGLPWSTDTTTNFKLYVNVASVNVPTSPTTATLGIEPAWIDQYNAAQSASAIQAQQDYLADTSHHVTDPKYPYDWTPMELLPDSLYTVSSFDLTVPANQREAFADLAIRTDKFEDGHNYVLPVTILQSSLNISSWNHLPLWFISSVFAGTYNNFHAHTVGGPYDQTYDDVMTLTTVDQHTVAEPGSIGDFFGGYTEYHFNGDGSVSVKAGTSASSPNSYGAEVVESSSDAQTGDFYVKFKILSGKYTLELHFNR